MTYRYSAYELDSLEIPERRQITTNPLTLLEGTKILLWGAESSGKTMFAMASALDAAATGTPVVLILGEGSLGANRDRLRQLCKARGCSLGALWLYVVFADHLDLTQLTVEVGMLPPGYRLLVVDPVAHFLVGDENRPDDVHKFLAVFDKPIENGAAVMLLHHSRKGGRHQSTDVRGSTAFRAWADSVHGFRRDERGKGPVRVTHEKERDGEVGPERSFNMVFAPAGIVIVPDESPRPTETPANPARATGGSNEGHKMRIEALLMAGPKSKSELRKVLRVSGGTLNELLQELVSEGRVAAPEQRGATYSLSTGPFAEVDR